MPAPNKHYELDSVLVAITTSLSGLASEISEEPLHTKSLELRLGDSQSLFDEACNLLRQINELTPGGEPD